MLALLLLTARWATDAASAGRVCPSSCFIPERAGQSPDSPSGPPSSDHHILEGEQVRSHPPCPRADPEQEHPAGPGACSVPALTDFLLWKKAAEVVASFGSLRLCDQGQERCPSASGTGCSKVLQQSCLRKIKKEVRTLKSNRGRKHLSFSV